MIVCGFRPAWVPQFGLCPSRIVHLALGLGRKLWLFQNGTSEEHPSAKQRWFRVNLHEWEHMSVRNATHMPRLSSALLIAVSWWSSTRGALATDRSRAAGPTRHVQLNASVAGTFGSQELGVPKCDHTWHSPRPRDASREGLHLLEGSAAAEPSLVDFVMHAF